MQKKKVQHEKRPTRKKVRQEKSATRKKVQHENSGTRKKGRLEYIMRKVQDEKAAI